MKLSNAWLIGLALWTSGAAEVSASETYGPVTGAETLSQIAIKFRPEPIPGSTCQTALAIYWSNPEAFLGSIHKLKPGARLKIPSPNHILTVDRNLALKLYSDPSYSFPKTPPDLGAAVSGAAVVAIPSTSPQRPPQHPGSAGTAGQLVAVPATASVGSGVRSVPTAPAPRRTEISDVTTSVGPASEKPPARQPVSRGDTMAHSSPPGTDAEEVARRRPGEAGQRPAVTPLTVNPNRESDLTPVAPPQRPWLPESWTKAPVPDRWRLLNSLDLVPQRWYDPYNQNTFKGDKPVRNGDEFLILSAIYDGIIEPRRFPQPVGPQSTTDAGSVGIFGGQDNTLFNSNIILSLVYLKGDTTFKPPDWEYHFLPVISLNYARNEEARVLQVDPRRGSARTDAHIGIQELFADYHLRNVSDRFDFDSFRVGIQPFSSDFRGFLFQDNQLMLRYFGTRDNNRWQFNLAWMRRLEKDTNTALNAVEQPLREDDTYIFNVYRQDFPVLGFTSQGIVAHNRNREGNGALFFNDNGFVERPASLGSESARSYEVTYVGYNGDGHFGRLNLTVSTYLALGQEDRGVFTDRKRDIAAGFGAVEASFDQDWIRWRASALYQSGDHDPYDSKANGFDAIFENPIFAGADTSFWFRQSVPLIGGGIVNLSQRNGLLNDLRSSKEHGQSNFANPGLVLAGLGNDMDLSPQVRLSFNFNHLWFDDTTTLEVARNQTPINKDIGWDLSTALIWRPFFQQNVIFRLSGAYLLPGDGFKDLFPDTDGYSVLGNLILTY